MRTDLRAALVALWASRLVVWVAGFAAIAIWGIHDRAELFDAPGLTRPYGAVGNLLVAPAARWDSYWYLEIARSGYDATAPARAAFFPLYPLLVKVVGTVVFSPLLGALLVSFGCFVTGLAALHRLAVIEIGAEGARWAVLALALFPGSLWFSAAYSESLFLALSVGAVLAARTGRFPAAALLAALACATRSAGILLLVPLALLWWSGRRADPAARGSRVLDLAWLALVPLGLLAYCAYLSSIGMDFTAPFSAQDVWNRAFTGPIAGVRDATVAAWQGARQVLHGSPEPVYFTKAGGDPLAVGRHNVALWLCLPLALWMLVGALRRLPLAHGAYAVAALALPLSYPVIPQPLMSLPRFLSVLYPLFLWLGWWLARGSQVRRGVTLGLFGLGLAGCSALFSTWHWVA